MPDGDLIIFESGAILLHLGEKSPAPMPTDPRGRAEVVEWVIAALSGDLPSQPRALFRFMGFPGEAPEAKLGSFAGRAESYAKALTNDILR